MCAERFDNEMGNLKSRAESSSFRTNSLTVIVGRMFPDKCVIVRLINPGRSNEIVNHMNSGRSSAIFNSGTHVPHPICFRRIEGIQSFVKPWNSNESTLNRYEGGHG